MKKTYIKPKATAVEIHQQLLYAVSGDDKEGEGWGGNLAKRTYYEFEEEEIERKKESFIIHW